MPIQIHQVDAFTNRLFKGNPAAVCLLHETMDDAWMQNLAAEMNLSETAFLLRCEDGFDLRWFTPETEVDLCGHATLASAFPCRLAFVSRSQTEKLPADLSFSTAISLVFSVLPLFFIL